MFLNLVAIVGRPNVGKSTLFNRLSKRKKAIVHDLAGVTRDRKYAEASIGPIDFTIVDTPGLEKATENSIESEMTKQGMIACSEADIVLFIVDYLSGITSQDIELAKIIRKQAKNIILVANKCEGESLFDGSYYKLGFGDPIAISAEHRIGMMELCEKLIPFMKDEVKIDEESSKNTIRLSIIGRPNVGKSTYINKLLNEERLVTSDIAGTTRDSIEIDFEYLNRKIKLIDTAGLRKKAKVSQDLEVLSCRDAIGAINMSHVVVVMIDSETQLEHQDLTILNFAAKEGRGIVIAVNKCDLVVKENLKSVLQSKIASNINTNLSEVYNIPIIYCSNLEMVNVTEVMDAVITVYDNWNKKIPTNKLNMFLKDVTEKHFPPLMQGGRRMKFKYITQINTRPAAFKIFGNSLDVPEEYRKYLLGNIANQFGLYGFQIRLFFNKSDNPFEKSKNENKGKKVKKMISHKK
jgi:GTPase